MSTSLSVITESPSSLDADAVVVGYHSTTNGLEPAVGVEDVDTAFPGGLARALALLGATGAAEEVHTVASLGSVTAPVVVAVGLGAAPKDGAVVDADTLARAAGAVLRTCDDHTRVALALPAGNAEQVEAVALGAVLGNYAFDRYRTSAETTKNTAEHLLVVSSADGAAEAAGRAETLATSVNLARDLVNTPPADLVPADLAAAAEEVARESDALGVETLDEQALVDGGYGGIVGVGQGSANPPRLVRLSYTHPQAERTIAFVGKGITFDSGGLSLKPASAMDWMKSDMGGAAAVLAAMRAIAALRPAINVVGYLAIAENMPSGTAQRPSDVLTMYGGKTVEVMNTDAEGRLVMADAIVRAHEDSPDIIVDVATLTGAQLVALGTRVFGVMAGDDATREEVFAAATAAGETSWPMPLPEELRKGLDSTVADIANVPSERWGGMLSAGMFLKEFVDDGMAWAHLDIAGPSFNRQEFGYTPTGGTGVATRTLVRLVEARAQN